ncbi:hypothetical protein O0L34_g8217 [Tuta absoluta]|nr:hypothetical protein O0L34_g8217 [Tuta absoluta]
MATCLQSLCLMVLATLYVACQGQCIVRAFMPSMAVMDCSSGQSCGTCDDSSSSATEDLSALLALARALEQDKANNANSGIDVNGLLDTLIHAMVCIAKPESSAGGYASGFPNSPISRQGTSTTSASPSAGKAGQTTPPAAGSGDTGVGGILNSVVDTVGGLLDGSGAGGVGEVLNTVTGTVGSLLGGGSGSGGLVDGVGKTVGGLTGGSGAGGGGLLGGLTVGGGSGLGGVVGGVTGGGLL